MKIYAMSDIHGCLAEFEQALCLVEEHLEEPNVMLLLLGDYVHGGPDGRGVLDKIMSLQKKYGQDKVVALLGNHEEFVLCGDSSVNHMIKSIYGDEEPEEDEDEYIAWMEGLPKYYVEGNTIFVHAGIDEDAGDLWEWCTDEYLYTSKYPAQIGQIPGLDAKVVAGHIYTSQISGDPAFHDIYYDGKSHYYIDGDVLSSGYISVLLVDTEKEEYFRVTSGGVWRVECYDRLI